jgi:hypothetical protein
MKSILLFLIFIFTAVNSAIAWAQEPVEQRVEEPKIKEATKPEPLDNEPVMPPQDNQVHLGLPDSTQPTTEKKGVERWGYYAMLNYSPIDLLIPSKFGVTAGLVKTNDTTWELEYLRGSLSVPFVVDDLGGMTDERFSLIGRHYVGNSFNWNYGATYFAFKADLGSKFVDRLPVDVPSEVKLIDIQALGFNLGLGNTWRFAENFIFGVDWIEWSQPVFILKKESSFSKYATNSGDIDIIDKAMNTASYFPRLTFLKVQLGMSF